MYTGLQKPQILLGFGSVIGMSQLPLTVMFILERENPFLIGC